MINNIFYEIWENRQAVEMDGRFVVEIWWAFWMVSKLNLFIFLILIELNS